MSWTYDSLWEKSKLYMARALREEREGALFAFWSSLAMELLARATLSAISPLLLADPNDPKNLFYALGYSVTEKPKSIQTKTVYSRLQLAFTDFTADLANSCMLIAERRNAELHSGDPVYDTLKTSIWLPQFFKAAKVLLETQNLNLQDFLGDNAETSAAEQMVNALDASYREDAERLIGQAKKGFFDLVESERTSRAERASQFAQLEAKKRGASKLECPSCGTLCVVQGKRIRTTQPLLDEDTLVWEEIYLPDVLTCSACQLELQGHALLQGAGLGGQFAEQMMADPTEYFSPTEEYFEEYNNM